MPSVVTAGETMVLATPAQPGRLRHATSVELRIGGAESNVAIALARLEEQVGWISWLSNDELGELVLARVRAEGVDTSQVRRIEGLTGLYMRERIGDAVRVYYYRSGSAASRMGSDAFDPSYLDGAQFVHLTGITPALSPACQAFMPWAMHEARRRGVKVSLDVNYRSKLWAPTTARSAIEELLPLVDLLFIGDEEAEALWGESGEALLHAFVQRGPSEVVLKRGAVGSTALVDGTITEAPAFAVTAVDPIGAGDAFAAGYLAGHLWRAEPHMRLRIANAMGAWAVMNNGDYEGLPTKAELWSFLEGRKELGR
ncbi:MAG TPA: sugar kinase [Herpetosiphonaceae bacterium]|nr:sugar kinase [Herpetosiphonaceae bacterium]